MTQKASLTKRLEHISSKNIDTNGDGKLSDAEIQAVNKMYLYESRDGQLVGLGIKDLTGIGLFTELTDLSCDNNEEIISPDLSKNLKLVYLSLQGCNLTVLDVSMLTELKGLYLAYNSLKSLDLRQNTKLESLYCPFNQLVSIKLAEKRKSTLITATIFMKHQAVCLTFRSLKNTDLT